MSSDNNPLGIPCPRCGCEKREVERVRKEVGRIVRIRRCKECRHDELTVEAPMFPPGPKSNATGSTSCVRSADLAT
jgi:hypothetical protein